MNSSKLLNPSGPVSLSVTRSNLAESPGEPGLGVGEGRCLLTPLLQPGKLKEGKPQYTLKLWEGEEEAIVVPWGLGRP